MSNKPTYRELLLTSISTAIASFVWYHVGRKKAHLKHYSAAHDNSLWVSVKDGLPTTDEEVIAISRMGRISFAHIVDRTMVKNYDGWNIPDVAFWMPFLPSEEMKAFYEKRE